MGQISQDYSQATDEALWAMSAEGDHAAETALIQRYQRLVRTCARPLFLEGGDSEDLLQEGMVGLLSAVRSYRPEGEAAFRTYAEVCIRSRLVSAVRAAGRAKHRPLNTSLPLEDGGVDAPPPPDPEEMVIDRENLAERLGQIENRLSGFERQVLRCYLNGLCYAEIAAYTHRPVKSVDNAVQRIRRKLAKHP